VRVSDRDPEQLRYLGGLGLFPGVDVTVVEQLPFEGPIKIRIDAADHIIGRPLAAAVHVAERAE
jgi:DtxR family Mn-dependent transcriptional regulator